MKGIDPRTGRRYARASRSAVAGTRFFALELARALYADAAFIGPRGERKQVLLYAVLCHADGEGKWWLKISTWASATGVSASTVKRAIEDAERAGLLEREAYLRPDGQQGSSTYRLRPELVAQALAASNVTSDPAGAGSGARAARQPNREVLDKAVHPDIRRGGSEVAHQNEGNEENRTIVDQFLHENRERGRWPTGVRRLRGTHSDSHVADPLGYDVAPYDVPDARSVQTSAVTAARAPVTATSEPRATQLLRARRAGGSRGCLRLAVPAPQLVDPEGGRCRI